MHRTESPSTYTPHQLTERIRAEQQAVESCGATDGERKTIAAPANNLLAQFRAIKAAGQEGTEMNAQILLGKIGGAFVPTGEAPQRGISDVQAEDGEAD